VAQSLDFALRLATHRETLRPDEAVTYEGVYMDTWWDRKVATAGASLKHSHFDLTAIQACLSEPLTILAVDAPNLSGFQAPGATYPKEALLMLAQKVSLIFHVAEELKSPCILSGLLGGGAFRGNRPLVLSLHMLLQGDRSEAALLFHHPIFRVSGGAGGVEACEQAVLTLADAMVAELRRRGVVTLEEAVAELQRLAPCLSLGDADLRPPPRSSLSSRPPTSYGPW